MNGSKTHRPPTSKPVNINISFTINPKNILNQQSFGIDNQFKNKKISNTIQVSNIDKQLNNSKPKTPDLENTQRVDINREFLYRQDDKKQKKSRKRNSVDQSYLNDYNKKSDGQKSENIKKEADFLNVRKYSTKSKKQSQVLIKRKHNKTTSKISAVDNFTIRHPPSGNILLMQQKTKNIKNIINRLITNQLSKKSLPIQLPTQQNRTARKKKISRKKQLKQGNSQNLFRRTSKQQDIDSINRKMIIQKLTSLRSMNNSIFHSEQDQQIKPRQRRTIVINTDHSIDCIDQIHEMQKAANKLYKQNNGAVERQRANQTKNLIDHYIAILNQNIEYQCQNIEEPQVPIEMQFENYKKKYQPEYTDQITKSQAQKFSKDIKQKQFDKSPVRYQQPQQPRNNYQQKQKNHLRQVCSSEMTKQQKMINQIQRIKLTQLKKHQVQKWGELLTFIKKSMTQGKANHDQILMSIYQFLQQTKMDLQKQILKDTQQLPKDKIEEFTNKFSASQVQSNKKSRGVQEQNQKQFNQISSMSYKDQNYEEDQNQELKLMNLEMIQNALKSRHQSLLDKRDRQIFNLEQQKNSGKITEADFIIQKEKIQKWTKKQTSEIMQARKNIWKGYDQAKGIIQKSLKSKYFQEQSSKKKSMMKCLSQNYLLKNYNYKKLLKADEEDDEQNDKQSIQSRQIQGKFGRHSKLNTLKICDSKKTSEQKKLTQKIQKQSPQKDQLQSNQQIYEHEKSLDEEHENFEFNGEQSRTIQYQIHNKKNSQNVNSELRNLHQEEDMNVIKQKLLNIKQKHLQQDSPENSPENSDQKNNNSNQEISYEQVDNQLQQSVSDNDMKLINQELGRQNNLPISVPAPDFDFQRLKHILPEDREDIFQFIFLDLSIQLYQEPCHDNRIMDSINKHVAYMKRQANKKKGVKTNLNVVKEYLKRFLGFILRGHRDILKTLDEPVGPTAIQMLRYMHQNDDDPIQGQQAPSPLVIPTTVFDAFEKSLLPSIQLQPYYEHDQERQTKRVQFLKNILHIHNKALFDAMNQYLDLLRPFGIWGKPFPWKKSSAFERKANQQQKQQKLKKSSQKVIQFCSYVCGLLVDKQQSLVNNARLSQDYIQQIKQDRLSRMLATELVQNEQRWLFYDDQQTQVLVEISNAIYVMMVRQATHEIYEIQRKNNINL